MDQIVKRVTGASWKPRVHLRNGGASDVLKLPLIYRRVIIRGAVLDEDTSLRPPRWRRGIGQKRN